jgi:short-subunit dehydrogenase
MERVALVTGGGSGMGRLAAQRWADAGMRVVAVDVNDDGLGETVGGRTNLHAQHCDVTDEAEVARVVKQVESDHGPIMRVLNAAAIARVGSLLQQDLADVRALFNVNVIGTAIVCQATVPGMLERGRGEVINFASLAGWIPQPKMGAYCATKFAMVAYTEALWMENRDRGVSFHCVCPPAVETPMLPDFFAEEAKRRKSMAIEPEKVIDEVDRAIRTGRFLVLPSAMGKVLWRTRRHTPNLLRRALTAERFDLVSEQPSTK